MKPEEFVKSFEFLVDAFITWTASVRNPSQMCRLILSEAQDEPDAVKRAIKLWVTSFLVTLFLQGWAYQLHGIGFGNISFYLSSGFFVLAVLLVMVVSIHYGFIFLKLSTPFRDTFVVYTVFVSAFSPIVGILVSPSLAQQLGALKTLKSQSPDLDSAVTSFISLVQDQQSSSFGAVALIGQAFVIILGLAQMAMVLDFLSERLKLERVRVFNAAALGMTIGFFPIIVIAVINMVMIYSFL